MNIYIHTYLNIFVHHTTPNHCCRSFRSSLLFPPIRPIYGCNDFNGTLETGSGVIEMAWLDSPIIDTRFNTPPAKVLYLIRYIYIYRYTHILYIYLYNIILYIIYIYICIYTSTFAALCLVCFVKYKGTHLHLFYLHTHFNMHSSIQVCASNTHVSSLLVMT